jgi:hypothetical protein
MSEKKITDYSIGVATIERVFWGVEPDKGILTSFIQLNYHDGTSQGFGGYAFDSYDKELKKRVEAPENDIAKQKLLNTFNISSLDNLVGKQVFAIYGWTEILAISPIQAFNFYSFLGIFKPFDENQFAIEMIEQAKTNSKLLKCDNNWQNELTSLKNIYVEKQHLETVLIDNNKPSSILHLKI